MEIENLSTLLSALIAALPTVMSLGIVAILAFPSRGGPVNTNKYYICSGLFVPIIALFISALIINIHSLLNLDIFFHTGNFNLLMWGIYLSIVSFIIMPIYLIIYVFMIPKIW